MRVSAQERVQASVMEPAQEKKVLEREQARRRWVQTLASVRRCPPAAQWANSRLQLPKESKTPLDDAT